MGGVWQPYIGQAVGGKYDVMVLIGGVEEQAVACFTHTGF
jgi:hypothetical protein